MESTEEERALDKQSAQILLLVAYLDRADPFWRMKISKVMRDADL